MTSLRTRFAAALALLVALNASPARGKEAVDTLVRLLPGEPALCVVIEDLRGHAEKLRDKNVASALFDTPLAHLLPQGLNRETLAEVERILQTHVQATLKEIVDDVLGDAVVLAYWPARDNEPERSVILARTRNPERAATLLNRFHAVQRQTGQVEKIETRSLGEAAYFRLLEAGGKEQFQGIHKSVLVLTEDERIVRHVLQGLTSPGQPGDFYRRFSQLGREPALVRVMLSPRVFDAELASKAETAPESEAAFVKEFLQYWRSIESLGLTLALDSDVTLSLHVRAETAKLPPHARRFLTGAAQPSALWNYVPADAVIALGGRFDVDAAWQIFQAFLPPEGRDGLQAQMDQTTQALFGLDFHEQIVGRLGPDMVAYAVPPAGLLSIMPDVVLAVQIRSEGDRRLESEYSDALKTLAGVIALARTQAGQPTVLRTRYTSFGRIVYLEGPGMPIPGIQPAAAIKDGCLVLALSPDSIIRFRRRDAQPFVAEKQHYPLLGKVTTKPLLDKVVNHPVHRTAAVGLLALLNGGNLVEANGSLDAIRDTLKAFESLEMHYRPADDGGGIELKVRLAK